MKLQLALATRELGSRPQRTMMVVAALALGVWGAGTPLFTWSVLEPDLAANFARTRPPHAVLHASNWSRPELAALVARPEIESAALRDFGIFRVEVKPDVWLPLFLYGVDDFDDRSIAALEPQAGPRRPPRGTALVERDGLRAANFTIGSAPRIRVGGTMRTLPISGVTFDASQAPATQDAFIYAYTDRETWSALTGEPTGKRLVVRFTGVRSAGDVRAAVANLERSLTSQGVAIEGAEVLRFEEHPHQWQLSTLLFAIGAVGALALLMAAVLVSQAMRALLAGQVRRVGTLKAIGATTGQVLRVAVLTASGLGALAGVLGVPLAVVTATRFSAFVAAQLNFDVLSSVPLGAIAGLALASLGLPLLFSLPTLVRGTRISVREALGSVRASLPARRSRRSALPPLLALALRNVARDRTRLVITVLSMAAGVAIFETGFNVRAALWSMLTETADENRHDVQVVLGRLTDREEVLATFRDVTNVGRLETWSGGRGEVSSRVLATTAGVGVVALPRDSDLLHLRLVQGRWLRPSAQLEVVLNQQGWKTYGSLAVGSPFEITIGDRTERAVLVGVAQQLDRAKLYLDQADFDARFNPRHDVTTVAFVANQRGYDDVLQLKRELERAVAGSSLEVLFVMSHAERVRIVYAHLDIILITLLVLSFLVLLVSGIGNASAVSVEVLQRTRELGVMRAIGASADQLSKLLRWEGLVVSGLGIAAGLVLALPLTRAAATFFGELMLGEGAALEPVISGPGVAVTVLVTFAFGLVASWLPARRALRVVTKDALAWET